jgi:hypothetical protein
MTASETESPEIIFFLGAGASVEADIPDTRKFISGKGNCEEGFLERLEKQGNQKELDVLNDIIKSLDEQKRNNLDVELILEILDQLNDKDKYHIHHFYEPRTFKFNSQEDFESLKKLEYLLRQFIREKVLAKIDKIDYLSPLLSFKKPLFIFSVNYDTCIELLSLKHNLSYTDGFELNWDEDLFDKKNCDIKLFKLHGSIIWYQTDSGNYLKLPITQDNIELITGEIANPFILYPRGDKGQFAKSLSYLSTQLQRHLTTAKICVVVGYSFRDPQIRQIFFEMSKNNDSLTVLLVSPNAGEIFRNQLKYYDTNGKIPSSLSEKVICWNYSFGAVLKDYYLYRNLESSIVLLKSYNNQAENMRKSGLDYKLQFKECIFQAALPLEAITTIEKIFEKELGITPPEFSPLLNMQEQFKILYSLGILYFLNSDIKSQIYLNSLIELLNQIKSKGLKYQKLKEEKDETFNKKCRLTMPDPNRREPANPIVIKKAEDDISVAMNNIESFKQEFPKTAFPFFYWVTTDSAFYDAIKELISFIKLKIKLRYGISEKTNYLINIEKICSDILENRFISDSDDISEVDKQRIEDLQKLFDSLIQQLELMN